jgi:hypothetical protein
MKVYISGKITDEDFDVARAKFKQVEDLLQSAGFETVNPLEMCLEKGISNDETACMKADIQALLECDGIYMLPDWNDSKGAKLEYNIACSCGIRLLDCNMCSVYYRDRIKPCYKIKGIEVCENFLSI